MSNDHVQPPQRNLADRVARRREVAQAGHTGDERGARRGLTDEDPAVRATALRALERMGAVAAADVTAAAGDPDVGVRRGAAQVVARSSIPAGAGLEGVLGALLADPDPTVVEVAAWACGERLGRATEAGLEVPEPELLPVLAHLATEHDDALCREAAVAALGAIGDERGLPAILQATGDKATVRRRAVIALAPFDGPEVAEALTRAAADRDWQVRQAAEDQLDIVHGHGDDREADDSE